MARTDTESSVPLVECGHNPYPFNFSTLREGCLEPCLNKQIKWLIDSDDDYIVYVDEDFYVEWTMNDNTQLADCGALLTRVGQLEAADTSILTPIQVETYKRMVGEAVARMFEKNVMAADAALVAAERWIAARGQQRARVETLAGATWAVGVVAGVLLAATAFVTWRGVFTDQRPLLGDTFLGVLGAWLSVLQRTGGTDFDIGAGVWLYRREGKARIAIGGIGGLFVALLLRSGYVLPVANDSPSLTGALCLAAGLSERLVNSLTTALEGKTAIRDSATPPQNPPPGPQGDHPDVP